MKYDLICNETARLVTGNILDGNACGGKSCKLYDTCVARKQFDALTKHTPTDAELDAAYRKEVKYGVKQDASDILTDPLNSVLVKRVYIPTRAEHAGIYGAFVKLRWVCPRCGAPRGQIMSVRSYDGSKILYCDGWENPCGHVDKYADLLTEAAENGLNVVTSSVEEIKPRTDAKILKTLNTLVDKSVRVTFFEGTCLIGFLHTAKPDGHFKLITPLRTVRFDAANVVEIEEA